MLLQASTALKLTIPFIIGISIGRFFDIPFIAVLTVWFFTLLIYGFHFYFGRRRPKFRNWLAIHLVIVFFLSGILGYSVSTPKNVFNHYTHFFLKGDSLSVEVVDYQKTTGRYDKAIVEVNSLHTNGQNYAVSGRFLAYIENNLQRLSPGYTFLVSPEFSRVKKNNNPGEFDQVSYWKNKRINQVAFLTLEDLSNLTYNTTFTSFWYNVHSYLEDQLEDHLRGDALALAKALSLGDRYMLKTAIKTSFANSGAMHILAVSGLHVGILLMLLNGVFYAVPLLRNKNAYLYISLIVLWSFALITGLSPSVFRAVLMFTILAFGQLKGKEFFNLNSLVISALFLLFIDPYFLFDIGFQLSYLSMLGIIFFYPMIKKLFSPKNRIIQYFWEGTAIGIAAQIGTVPMTLYYFHQFPNYFILSNILLMGLSVIALSAIMVFFIFHMVPEMSSLVSLVIDYVMEAIVWVVTFIDNLPFSVAKGFIILGVEVLLAYVFIFLLWRAKEKRNLRQWMSFSSLLFLLSLVLVFQRYMQLNSRELVVFNHYEPIVAWKEKSIIYCFYPEDRVNYLNKLELLVKDYGNLSEGEIRFVPIKGKEEVWFSPSKGMVLRLINQNHSFSVEVAGKTYILPFTPKKYEGEQYITLYGKYTKNATRSEQMDEAFIVRY